jgi:hypothetical protein
VKFSVPQLALARKEWSIEDIMIHVEDCGSHNNTITRRVIPQAEPNLPKQGRWSTICRAAPCRVARLSFLFRSVGRESDVTSLNDPHAVQLSLYNEERHRLHRAKGTSPTYKPIRTKYAVVCRCCIIYMRSVDI